MQIDAETLEAIVREVIRRLTSQGHSVSSSGNADDSAVSANLQVDDKLVTMATLHRKLSGIKQVVVRRRAIVTPAVKDELKKRHIALVRE